MGSRFFKEGERISGKKLFFGVLFFCLPLFFISGQENPIDLVLILDTSSSMSGFYQNSIDYVTGGFLKEFLRIGDTFHLISFSDTPRLEIVRRIEGRGDIETLIGRLFLMYPLEPRSDISGALAYGEQYAASIPGTRQKKVVFVSDGDPDPPREGPAGDSLQDRIAGTTARLNRAGIDFYYVPVPVLGTGPSSGRSQLQPAPAQQPTPPVVATTPRPQQPAAPAQQARPPTPAATTRPQQPAPPIPATTPRPQQPAAPAQQARPQTPAATPRPQQPAAPAQQATPPAPATTPRPQQPAAPAQQARPPAPAATTRPQQPAAPAQQARPAATTRPQQPAAPAQQARPQTPATRTETAPKPQAGERFGFPLPWFMGIILGAVLILALVFLLITKQLQNFPNRTFARAAGKEPKKSPVSGKAKTAPDEPVSPPLKPLASNETARRQTIPNKTAGASPVQQAVIPPKTAPHLENTTPPRPAPAPQASPARNTAKSTGNLLEKIGIFRKKAVSPAIPLIQQAVIPAKTASRPENSAPPRPAPVSQASPARDTAKGTGSLLEKAGILRNQAVSPAIPPVQQAGTPAKTASRPENSAPPRPALAPQASPVRNTAKSTGNLLEKIGIFRKKAVSPAIPLIQQAGTPPKTASRPENTALPLPAPAPVSQAPAARDTAKSTGSSGVPRKLPAVNSASYKKNPQTDNGPLLLSLFVEDQNTNIGRRNVHSLKAGYSLTIGGGKSDFLIFLVPVPPRIAEIHYDDARCTLIPRQPEFFPGLGSEPLPDCIGIPIRILSERNYELIIRLDRYEDPLITLNRLLHSVDVPGHSWRP